MDNRKHKRPFEEGAQERELLELLAHTIEEAPGSAGSTTCPSADELRLLDRGLVHELSHRTSLLAHLADCNHCIQLMKRIREERILEDRIRETLLRRRRMFVRSALGIAAALVIAVIIFLGVRYRSTDRSPVVTAIDLRLASTRGNEKSALPRARVRRPSARFRILLPFGTDGSYEAAIVAAGSHQKVLAAGSSSTQVEDHSVVLNLSADVSTLKPGDYELALRRRGSEWEYYPLTVK